MCKCNNIFSFKPKDHYSVKERAIIEKVKKMSWGLTESEIVNRFFIKKNGHLEFDPEAFCDYFFEKNLEGMKKCVVVTDLGKLGVDKNSKEYKELLKELRNYKLKDVLETALKNDPKIMKKMKDAPVKEVSVKITYEKIK